MNNTQTNHRTIKVKEFLDDFRSGMFDDEILKAYNLTPLGLEKFYSMLVDRNILTEDELKEHYERELIREKEIAAQDAEKVGFICPCCLESQDKMFDICPNCGVSFQEFVSRESCNPSQIEETVIAAQPISEISANKETPPAGEIKAEPHKAPAPADLFKDDFIRPEDFRRTGNVFDDSDDDVVPGMPLDYIDDIGDMNSTPVLCESCGDQTDAITRKIFDKSSFYQALTGSVLLILLGFLGAVVLSFFEAFSFGKLVLLYGTGTLLVLGSVLSALSVFMFLAKERVYSCPKCKRAYARLQ